MHPTSHTLKCVLQNKESCNSTCALVGNLQGFAKAVTEKSSRWQYESLLWLMPFHNRSSSSNTIKYQLQFLSQSHLCCFCCYTSIQLLFTEVPFLAVWTYHTTALRDSQAWCWLELAKCGSWHWHGMSGPSLEVRDACYSVGRFGASTCACLGSALTKNTHLPACAIDAVKTAPECQQSQMMTIT